MKEEEDMFSQKFSWTIENFSKLKGDKHDSDVFIIGGFKWRIHLYPKGSIVKDYLSVYLVVPDASTLPSDWSRYARFSLTVVNQIGSKHSVTYGTDHEFNANTTGWGFNSFVLLSKLCDNHREGYIVNDICIIEADVSVRKSEIKILEDQEIDELIDFRGLGRIEKAFVPLLEEVCSLHPSLIEGQQKRSRVFIQCAFTCLGQFLHFLKTTKVKDMTQDACEHLQLLWEELESTFKFDLAWLEPHLQSVFSMKERAGRVNRLREDVDALENEIKRRRDMLAAAEVDLEVAKRDLSKAEEGFIMMDMDSEVGCPLS